MGRMVNAMSRLYDSDRASNGYAATISRGVSSCPATVVLGRGDRAANVQNNFAVETDAQDVFIAAADYKPTGPVSEPQLNDRIALTVQGVAITLRVVVRGQDKQTFVEEDPEGMELRVFTKTF